MKYARTGYLVFILIVSGVLTGCASLNPVQQNPVFSVEIPGDEPNELASYGRMEFEPISESSGIVKSPLWDNVYWTLNDSGDEARIFAVRRDGEIVRPEWTVESGYDYQGIKIPDAVNIDWEDIAVDDSGNLAIGAFGNNGSQRRDLSIYILAEPYPEDVIAATTTKRIMFRYPDQTSFPMEQKNFDCEAFFFANGKYYFLTKHRSDKHTKLYRMDRTELFTLNDLTLLGEFDVNGYVTAADAIATDKGNRLAVLTYHAVWIFETKDGSDDYFNGSVLWYPIKAKQCEGICFDNADTLIITNEQRDIYELKLSQFKVIRE